jgi:hypothetical protein
MNNVNVDWCVVQSSSDERIFIVAMINLARVLMQSKHAVRSALALHGPRGKPTQGNNT